MSYTNFIHPAVLSMKIDLRHFRNMVSLIAFRLTGIIIVIYWHFQNAIFILLVKYCFNNFQVFQDFQVLYPQVEVILGQTSVSTSESWHLTNVI